MMYALTYLAALFVLPGVVILAGAEVMDRVRLTPRGVSVVAGGMFGLLGLLGVFLILAPAPYIS
jgi:hypothetical protein